MWFLGFLIAMFIVIIFMIVYGELENSSKRITHELAIDKVTKEAKAKCCKKEKKPCCKPKKQCNRCNYNPCRCRKY
uniref:Uncharacterized protein n=1 Tax=viral metagenome TaxID=1070528 RepID=A0A6C0DH39_9ZZZZ